MTDLPAGRELDALIAERVMGWTRQLAPDGTLTGWAEGYPVMVYQPLRLPPFSTDIAAAWDILEKLAHLEPHLSRYSCGWMVVIQGGEGCKWEDVDDTDISAPLAICRAALKAVGA